MSRSRPRHASGGGEAQDTEAPVPGEPETGLPDGPTAGPAKAPISPNTGGGARADVARGTEPRRAPARGAGPSGADRVPKGPVLHLLVLAASRDDTTTVNLGTGAVLRLRVPWPDGHEPDLAPFDVVEAAVAPEPEPDDLAHPEAVTSNELPRQIGTMRGRRVRRMLARLSAPADGPLLGFAGPSAPYWEFRGARPSVALIVATRGPQLLRRHTDGSTWVRFGWNRDDVWLPVEDRHAVRALEAARRDRLSGKDLANALGFKPQYLLTVLSRPRDGYCYKICSAILPRG